jgi:hypothetical protein
MRRCVVESPFAGDVVGNIAYARRCIRDCLLLGEAPIASHLLYLLRDQHGYSIPIEFRTLPNWLADGVAE